MKLVTLRGISVAAAACALAAGVPAGAQQQPDSTSFIKAVKDGDGAKAIALLGAPGSTVAKTREPGTGETALHIVVRRRDVPWINFMLQQGVDPNVADRSGETPLGLATRLGFSEGARRLIRGGARVDGEGASGETPLIIAVLNRNLDMTKLLVLNGANPDKPDSAAGYSARDYAARDRRSPAILKALDDKPPVKAAPAKPGPAKAAPAR